MKTLEEIKQNTGFKDYIDREAVLAEYDRQHKGPPGGARKIIAEFPAANVWPVVQCAECDNSDVCYGRRLCELWGVHVNDNDFCSRGEKMEGKA